MYSALDPSVSQRVQDTDDELFSAVMANSDHVLHHMLPDRTSHPYTLRPRRHDCSLTVKEDSRNSAVAWLQIKPDLCKLSLQASKIHFCIHEM